MFRNRLRNRQAESGSRNRVVRRARAAEEALEQAALLRPGDADSVVLDLDDSPVAVGVQRNGDAAPFGCELQRVRDEIVEHLSEAGRVADNCR